MFQVNQNSLLVKGCSKVIFSATKLLKCKKKKHITSGLIHDRI